jgi:Mrp family chromosome partitioning ATPase
LAVVGVPNLGIAAAIEAGVAVERIVLAQPPRASREWVATVAALVEGFEVLIVATPTSLSASDARRLQTRVMARQAVLIVVDLPALASVGEASVFASDIDVHAITVAWSGIERGAAHITQRTVQVRVNGRRCSSPREQTITLPC